MGERIDLDRAQLGRVLFVVNEAISLLPDELSQSIAHKMTVCESRIEALCIIHDWMAGMGFEFGEED